MMKVDKKKVKKVLENMTSVDISQNNNRLSDNLSIFAPEISLEPFDKATPADHPCDSCGCDAACSDG